MRQYRKLSMLMAVVLLALTLGGCIRQEGVHGGDPSGFTHLQAARLAAEVMEEAYVMLLVDEYLACEGDSARASFVKKRLAEAEVTLHADRVELCEYRIYYDYDIYYDSIYRVVYIDSEGLAASSKGYSYNGTTIISKGGEFYDVVKDTPTISAEMVLIYRRGAFGSRDLLGAQSATIAMDKDGLKVDMATTDLLMATCLQNTFYGTSFRYELFNGRIDVDIKSSAMDSPDHYSYSYNYSGNYDKL